MMTSNSGYEKSIADITENHCKICHETVTLNSGLYCYGPRKHYIHFKCLNFSETHIEFDEHIGHPIISPCLDCYVESECATQHEKFPIKPNISRVCTDISCLLSTVHVISKYNCIDKDKKKIPLHNITEIVHDVENSMLSNIYRNAYNQTSEVIAASICVGSNCKLLTSELRSESRNDLIIRNNDISDKSVASRMESTTSLEKRMMEETTYKDYQMMASIHSANTLRSLLQSYKNNNLNETFHTSLEAENDYLGAKQYMIQLGYRKLIANRFDKALTQPATHCQTKPIQTKDCEILVKSDPSILQLQNSSSLSNGSTETDDTIDDLNQLYTPTMHLNRYQSAFNQTSKLMMVSAAIGSSYPLSETGINSIIGGDLPSTDDEISRDKHVKDHSVVYNFHSSYRFFIEKTLSPTYFCGSDKEPDKTKYKLLPSSKQDFYIDNEQPTEARVKKPAFVGADVDQVKERAWYDDNKKPQATDTCCSGGKCDSMNFCKSHEELHASGFTAWDSQQKGSLWTPGRKFGKKGSVPKLSRLKNVGKSRIDIGRPGKKSSGAFGLPRGKGQDHWGKRCRKRCASCHCTKKKKKKKTDKRKAIKGTDDIKEDTQSKEGDTESDSSSVNEKSKKKNKKHRKEGGKEKGLSAGSGSDSDKKSGSSSEKIKDSGKKKDKKESGKKKGKKGGGEGSSDSSASLGKRKSKKETGQGSNKESMEKSTEKIKKESKEEGGAVRSDSSTSLGKRTSKKTTGHRSKKESTEKSAEKIEKKSKIEGGAGRSDSSTNLDKRKSKKETGQGSKIESVEKSPEKIEKKSKKGGGEDSSDSSTRPGKKKSKKETGQRNKKEITEKSTEKTDKKSKKGGGEGSSDGSTSPVKKKSKKETGQGSKKERTKKSTEEIEKKSEEKKGKKKGGERSSDSSTSLKKKSKKGGGSESSESSSEENKSKKEKKVETRKKSTGKVKEKSKKEYGDESSSSSDPPIINGRRLKCGGDKCKDIKKFCLTNDLSRKRTRRQSDDKDNGESLTKSGSDHETGGKTSTLKKSACPPGCNGMTTDGSSKPCPDLCPGGGIWGPAADLPRGQKQYATHLLAAQARSSKGLLIQSANTSLNNYKREEKTPGGVQERIAETPNTNTLWLIEGLSKELPEKQNESPRENSLKCPQIETLEEYKIRIKELHTNPTEMVVEGLSEGRLKTGETLEKSSKELIESYLKDPLNRPEEESNKTIKELVGEPLQKQVEKPTRTLLKHSFKDVIELFLGGSARPKGGSLKTSRGLLERGSSGKPKKGSVKNSPKGAEKPLEDGRPHKTSLKEEAPIDAMEGIHRTSVKLFLRGRSRGGSRKNISKTEILERSLDEASDNKKRKLPLNKRKDLIEDKLEGVLKNSITGSHENNIKRAVLESLEKTTEGSHRNPSKESVLVPVEKPRHELVESPLERPEMSKDVGVNSSRFPDERRQRRSREHSSKNQLVEAKSFSSDELRKWAPLTLLCTGKSDCFCNTMWPHSEGESCVPEAFSIKSSPPDGSPTYVPIRRTRKSDEKIQTNTTPVPRINFVSKSCCTFDVIRNEGTTNSRFDMMSKTVHDVNRKRIMMAIEHICQTMGQFSSDLGDIVSKIVEEISERKIGIPRSNRRKK